MRTENGSTLLIDNSNTRTKFMLADNKGLQHEQRILPTADITPETVHSLLTGWTFRDVTLCSVVPKTREILKRCFRVPVSNISISSPLNLKLNYDGANTLGADRIANAVAVASKGRFPCIAIDLGTATTIDVVIKGAKGPEYIGGAIAPGIASFNHYLAHCTAQLPVVEPTKPHTAIGRNTREAIQAGIIIGYRGLVRELLHSITKELGQKATITATGGDASLLARELKELDDVDPLLTFHGIHLISKLALRHFFD